MVSTGGHWLMFSNNWVAILEKKLACQQYFDIVRYTIMQNIMYNFLLYQIDCCLDCNQPIENMILPAVRFGAVVGATVVYRSTAKKRCGDELL